ncbi:MAG: OmpA family protein [Pasteurellaceae bacterium]|nr:OmpA family protein [Pasteurellaceae bacterium]
MIVLKSKKNIDDHHWLTISDLMSGLMIIFIFIATGFMRTTIIERDRAKAELEKITHIAETYQKNQQAIYNALVEAFPDELLSEKALNAEIDSSTLTFIFKSSDTLFASGSFELKEDYKKSLIQFYPRYIQAILPYKESISEIRIEGHTNSIWSDFPKDIKDKSVGIKNLYGYFENMKLSQARTNSVLRYLLNDLKELIPGHHQDWIKNNMAAVGLSSSKPILDKDGKEDIERSRRVTFRIITNADSKIQQILEESILQK